MIYKPRVQPLLYYYVPMKYIALTKGYFARVSDEDYKELSKHKWHVALCGSHHMPYACRRRKKADGPGKARIYMHRVVMGEPEGMVIDHLDNDTLNNTRENLEAVTAMENKYRNGAFVMLGSKWSEPPPGPEDYQK